MINPKKSKELYESASMEGGLAQYIKKKGIKVENTNDQLEQPILVEVQEKIPMASNNMSKVTTKDRNLNPLRDFNGVVYKFNRGVIMYSEQGTKRLDIIDRNDRHTHHADLLERIPRLYFNNPIEGTRVPMENARRANEKKMTALLFEGSSAQIYLPEEAKIEVLEDIKKELEPRKNFTFYIAENGKVLVKEENNQEVFAWKYDEINEYLDQQIKELKEKEPLTEEEYLEKLLEYITKENTDLYTYYKKVVSKYQNNQEDSLEPFEKKNPWINKQRIKEKDTTNYLTIAKNLRKTLQKMNDKQIKLDQEAKKHQEKVNQLKKLEANMLLTMIDEINNKNIKPSKIPTVTNLPREFTKKELEKIYYEELLDYTTKNKISMNDYFTKVGNLYINNQENQIPNFEKYNPFLTKESIKKLVKAKEENMPIYFASIMETIMNQYANQQSTNNQLPTPKKKVVSKNGTISKEGLLKNYNNRIQTLTNLIEGIKNMDDSASDNVGDLNQTFVAYQNELADLMAKRQKLLTDKDNQDNLPAKKTTQKTKKNQKDTQTGTNQTSQQPSVLLENKYSKEAIKKAHEADYFNGLQDYMAKNNMSMNDYFTHIGQLHKTNKEEEIPVFEKNNPYIKKEDIQKLVTSADENSASYFAATMEQIMNQYQEGSQKYLPSNVGAKVEKETILLENKYSKEAIKKAHEADYFNGLQDYMAKNNMSMNDYFTHIGQLHKTNKEEEIPVFEKNNPYIKKEDIQKLVTSADENSASYFAATMEQIMNQYQEESQKNLPSNVGAKVEKETLLLENKYEQTEENLENYLPKNNLKGFQVETEKDSNKANISAFAPNKTTKKKELSAVYRIKDGKYVNITEYMDQLLENITSANSTAETLKLKTKENEEISYQELCKRAFLSAQNSSKISLGTKNNPENYEMETKENRATVKYDDMTLYQGIYIRESQLNNFMKDYKIYTVKNNQSSSTNKTYQK